MAMRINNIGYLLKEGIRGIFLHGLMSFAAVCVTVACLLIVGSVSALVYNVSVIVEDLNRTSEVLVYIDEKLPEAEARQITTEINRIENVWQATFVSREEALEEFIKDNGGISPDARLVPDEVWDLYAQHGGNIHLDGAWRATGGHTVFGQVYAGMDVVDAIAGVKTGTNDKPETDVIIESVEITTYASDNE